MVMHPYRPELNGQSLLEYSDPAGKKLFVEYTKIVGTQGHGYVEYLWQWKDDEQRLSPSSLMLRGLLRGVGLLEPAFILRTCAPKSAR
jgi:hypothetical protein